jgi:HSP20 family protein
MNAVAEQVEKSTQAQSAETPREYVAPGVNILETADAYVLEAEMPGVKKDGLDITVEDNLLTLVGRRQTSEASPVYQESRRADFRRSFELDPGIETGRITATIEQGLLTVTLPKAEKAKPRQIQVS